jgi:hypothetical protein
MVSVTKSVTSQGDKSGFWGLSGCRVCDAWGSHSQPQQRVFQLCSFTSSLQFDAWRRCAFSRSCCLYSVRPPTQITTDALLVTDANEQEHNLIGTMDVTAAVPLPYRWLAAVLLHPQAACSP